MKNKSLFKSIIGPIDVEFNYKFNENFIVGIFLLIAVCVWRAQIAATQTNSLAKKDVQALPSMTYTAKLMSKIKEITTIFAAQAVYETSLLQQGQYLSLKPGERTDFVKNNIVEASTSGQAKILQPRQIINNQQLQIHRRGIIAKLRGTTQALTLYKCSEVIGGTNILILTWDKLSLAILNLILEICTDLTLENLVTQLEKYCKEKAIEIDLEQYQEDKSKVALYLFELIFYFHVMGNTASLEFSDGIIVSSDESNKTLIEVALDLVRHKPHFIEKPEINSDEIINDPFLQAAIKNSEMLEKQGVNIFKKEPNKSRSKKRGKKG